MKTYWIDDKSYQYNDYYMYDEESQEGKRCHLSKGKVLSINNMSHNEFIGWMKNRMEISENSLKKCILLGSFDALKDKRCKK